MKFRHSRGMTPTNECLLSIVVASARVVFVFGRIELEYAAEYEEEQRNPSNPPCCRNAGSETGNN